jgi:hypothetical protein
MNERIRGRTNRVPDPTLPVFLRSNAPDAFKMEVQAILGQLARFDTLNEAGLLETDPELLARIEALSGAGLDLFRVLRGEKSCKSTYTRQNISASLRQKLHEHQGQLSEADYPARHIVPVMAWVYWGSIEAWVTGRPGRTCLPKGHWRQRGNQIAALQGWAKTHPGEPLTHKTLHAAGLHSLATALTATALAALAAKLSLKRNLKQRPAGSWTRTAVIEAYAELCRAHGITLSSSALIAIGGAGYTLRGRARQLFGSFAAFQDAVVECHPGIKPPNRPTARDGRCLDSWQEVVAYHAIRIALPDALINTHVLLASTRRSCDFVLNGFCHVEVLRYGKAEMATPRNADAQKYATQWSAKMAVYQTMGVTPIMIEPSDINNPERLAERMAEIATKLAMPMQPLPAPSGKVVHAKGYWSFDTLCAAVVELADATGEFPTYAELTKAGYGHAAMLLRQPGMAVRVASEIGHVLRHQKGIWSEERVVTELAAWAAEHGQFPTGDELAADGLHLLHGARRRLFAGRPEELRSLVEQRCGKTLPQRVAPRGSYATLDQLASLLQPICDELGRFPTGAEMNARLPETVYSEVSRRCGLANMAEYMGVPYTGPRRLTKQEALALFRDVAAAQRPALDLGIPPNLTTTQIARAMGSRGIALMQRHFGNIDGLRQALAEAGRPGADDGTSGKTNKD